MLDPKYCPYCKKTAAHRCPHLAVAAEGRDFVRLCVEHCQGQKQWQSLCTARHKRSLVSGDWYPEQEDFTWLETAFCDEFLKPLRWFGAMDYEWRSGRSPAHSGFWVLLWSKDPQRLWWELRDEFERQALAQPPKMRSQLPPPTEGGPLLGAL